MQQFENLEQILSKYKLFINNECNYYYILWILRIKLLLYWKTNKKKPQRQHKKLCLFIIIV